MRHTRRSVFSALAILVAVALLSSGCTSFNDYIHNGFKVGPNYCRPPAPVPEHWIDQADLVPASDRERLCRWWTIFNDPKLNELIACAYRQNLTLKEAGFRILQARATLGIAVGNLFPQQQDRLRRLSAYWRLPWTRLRPRSADGSPTMGLRLQSELGTRFLGPVPPRRGRGRRPVECVRGRLRRRAGHAAGRRGRKTTSRCAPTRNGSPCCRPTWNCSAAS